MVVVMVIVTAHYITKYEHGFKNGQITNKTLCCELCRRMYENSFLINISFSFGKSRSFSALRSIKHVFVKLDFVASLVNFKKASE